MHDLLKGLAFFSGVSMILGCITPPPGSIEIPPTPESAQQVELSFSRLSVHPEHRLSASIPSLPDEGDISFPVSGVSISGNQLPGPRTTLDQGGFSIPSLPEGAWEIGDLSFPGSAGPAGFIDREGVSVWGREGSIKAPPHFPVVEPLPLPDRVTLENQGENRTGTPALPPGQQASGQPKAASSASSKDNSARQSSRTGTTTAKEAAVKEEPRTSAVTPGRPEQTPKQPSKEFPLYTDPLPQKKVEGEVGKTVRIVLPGVGWIYLGEKDHGGKVKYVGKDTSAESTTFTFALIQEGEAILQFQKQDLLAKTTTYDTVLVTTARDSKQAAGGTKEGKAPLVPGTATLGPSASLGGSEKSPSLPGEDSKPTESFSRQMDRLLKEGKQKEAVRLIEEYLQEAEGTESVEKDRLYFTLARLYEEEPEVKDIKKALSYYEKVRDQFPFSPYWEEADYRSRYIRRNFFEIR